MLSGEHPEYIPCLLYHPQTTSCFQGTFDAFYGCAKKTALMYFIVTTLPLVLRSGVREIAANPLTFAKTAAFSSARHILFLSAFTGTFQGCVCLFEWAYRHGLLMKHR